MNTATKKSFLLGVCAAALLGYVTFFVLSPEPMSDEGFIFTGVDREEIEKISIESEFGAYTFVNPYPKELPDRGTQDMELDPEILLTWQLEDVPTARLNTTELNSLIINVLQTRVLNPLTPQEDLSMYGLDVPGVRIAVKYLGGSHVIEIGDRSEFVGTYFALLDGKDLFMVEDRLIKAALKPVTEFRDLEILQKREGEVREIKIVRDLTHRIVLRRDADGWNIYEPDFYPCDQGAVQTLLKSLFLLTTKSFFEIEHNPLDSAGLENPAIKFVVNDGLGRRILMLSDVPSDTLRYNLFAYIEGEPSLSLVDKGSIGTFPLSLFALRKKRFVSFNPEDISTVTLEMVGRMPLSLERSTEGWKVNGFEGDTPFIEKFLKDLSQMEAAEFPDYGEMVSFEHPRLRLVLKKKDGRELIVLVAEQLKVLSPQETQYFVMGADVSEPYLIDARTFRAISPSAEMLSVVIPIQEE